MSWRVLAAAFILFLTAWAVTGERAWAGPTLDSVRERGLVLCGANVRHLGFSYLRPDGRWTGLETDVCRALAAAVLGDAERVRFVPLSAQARFQALKDREVDLLMRSTSWTLVRDASLGLSYAGVLYYDAQAFVARRDLGAETLAEADAATVCLEAGTSSRVNLEDFMVRNGLNLRTMSFESAIEARRAFFTGRCDLYTGASSMLVSMLALDAPDPADYVILPERIAKQPKAAVLRNDDEEWLDIVRWVIFALIEAEELGITRDNAEALLEVADGPRQRFLGRQPGLGAALGLEDAWAFRAVLAVGNYGEIFARNLGPDTPLGLERGLNALWTEGGLLYAMPFR